MGARGPMPTPTATLQMRGSKRAKSRAGEVAYPKGAPPCPPHLDRVARNEWHRQVRHLDQAGVLQKTDRALLAAYCEAWSVYVELTGLLRASTAGPLTPSEKVAVWELRIRSGFVGARNNTVQQLVQLADRFGFSPAARARVKADAAKGDDGDQLDQFLGNAG